MKLLANRIALLKLEEKKVSYHHASPHAPTRLGIAALVSASCESNLKIHSYSFSSKKSTNLQSGGDRFSLTFVCAIANMWRGMTTMCGNLVRSLSFLQAWKKIEDTKKKAVEIMKVRQRNLDTRNEKQSLAAQRAEEDR